MLSPCEVAIFPFLEPSLTGAGVSHILHLSYYCGVCCQASPVLSFLIAGWNSPGRESRVLSSSIYLIICSYLSGHMNDGFAPWVRIQW